MTAWCRDPGVHAATVATTTHASRCMVLTTATAMPVASADVPSEANPVARGFAASDAIRGGVL